MLGSNPSADSVASTDSGGCCGIPLNRYLRAVPSNRERHQSAKSWGSGGKAPTSILLPTPTAFLNRAPFHNACIQLTPRHLLHRFLTAEWFEQID